MTRPLATAETALRSESTESLRTYPIGVSLLSRTAFDIDTSVTHSVDEVEMWLLKQAGKFEDTSALIKGFAEKLVQAGLGVSRLSLSVGTLHPQAMGFSWHWNLVDRLFDEIQLSEDALSTDAYLKSPLYRTMEHGELLEISLDPVTAPEYGAWMQELGAAGFTQYLAVPLPTRQGRYNAVTIATTQVGGFHREQKTALCKLLAIFALHVERHVAERITENLAHAYLGRQAARRVVSGTIKRGGGRPIQAIVWSSDMRGFSSLSENMDSRIMAQLLDRYFSVMAEAVIKHGGDVLKFIGDGMLAVFLVEDFDTPEQAAKAASDAARDALRALNELNEDQSATRLQTGIGLHLGEVFFGNIGSARRLDFTVIGEAVNISSHVEGLCKPLDRNILMTAPVASLLTDRTEDMGRHSLKGISRQENLFALPLQH